jgi:hypothetical protein
MAIMPDDQDDAVHIIRALDPATRERLHRLSVMTGRHPFELAAEMLRDILAEDEAAHGEPPPDVSFH